MDSFWVFYTTRKCPFASALRFFSFFESLFMAPKMPTPREWSDQIFIYTARFFLPKMKSIDYKDNIFFMKILQLWWMNLFFSKFLLRCDSTLRKQASSTYVNWGPFVEEEKACPIIRSHAENFLKGQNRMRKIMPWFAKSIGETCKRLTPSSLSS